MNEFDFDDSLIGFKFFIDFDLRQYSFDWTLILTLVNSNFDLSNWVDVYLKFINLIWIAQLNRVNWSNLGFYI